MLSWLHSGFHVYISDRITPSDKTGLGNLARYIIRACFSQERRVYVPAENSTDGVAKVVDTSKDEKSRQNWARPIQKIYEVDPLVCQRSINIFNFGEFRYFLIKSKVLSLFYGQSLLISLPFLRKKRGMQVFIPGAILAIVTFVSYSPHTRSSIKTSPGRPSARTFPF